MHKSEEYGKILLKQKDKQNTEQIKNFAWKLARQFPYPAEVVERSVAELVAEGVLQIDGDFLIQKRMVHDNHVSIQRSLAGKKGGSFAQAKVKANTQAKYEAKGQANSEYEYATTNEDSYSSKEHKAPNSKKNETVELVFPYTGEKFMQVWTELIRGPKWKRKTKAALQASLIQIGEYSEGNEATAVQIMMNSLAGNWQGVFPIDRKNQQTPSRHDIEQRRQQGVADLRAAIHANLSGQNPGN